MIIRLCAFIFLAAALGLPAAARVFISRAMYEGAEHFVVRTPAATYWYDRGGGGLSRMIDRDGRDWIAFRREPWNQFPASAAASYRGMPNFVFGSADGGAGHPGFSRCVSTRAGDRIITTSHSGEWRWVWRFFDDHATVTMERAGGGGYWFLYEGIPGGAFAPRQWYWGNDRVGPIRDLPDFLKGERAIGNYRWAYFGDVLVPRVLFVAQQETDEIADSFAVMGSTPAGLDAPDGMVVFGFGRAREAKTLLNAAPQTFHVGFLDQPAAGMPRHETVREQIDRILVQPRRIRSSQHHVQSISTSP